MKQGRRKISVYQIIRATCMELRIDYNDLLGSGRSPIEVRARRIITLLCRRHTMASFPEIAKAFNRKSWSIFIERERKAKEDLADPKFASDVLRVEKSLLLRKGTSACLVPRGDSALKDDEVKLATDINKEDE